jgi:hypothetical protein
MRHRPLGVAHRGAVGAVLLLLGLASLGGWRLLSGIQSQPYASGATPPTSVHVTEGHSYSLAVPGGVGAMIRAGVPTTPTRNGAQLGLECSWSIHGAAAQALTVSAESVDTKAETTVGGFVAPATGALRITCAHWGAMYVPDSDDRAADVSGWLLVLSTIALTIGGALALSAGYAATATRTRTVSDDDEVERLVHVVPARGVDGEVGRDDGRHRSP